MLAATLRWPLVGDAPLFHYIVFLMHAGKAPYREIADLNLPGTYAVQALVIKTLGQSALAWRSWDLILLALAAVAIAFICKPQSRFAAIFAASLFALIHGRDGLIELGQRDLLLAVLMLGSYACLFYNLRRAEAPHPAATAGFGLLMGCAASVKPLALLLLPVLHLWLDRSVRRHKSLRRKHVAAAVAGACLPLAGVLGFLAYWHAWHAFLHIMTSLVPLHSSMFRLPLAHLLPGSVSSVLLPMFVLWLPVLWARRSWRDAEGAALLAGFCFGVFSFCVQGRGYPYHRYPLEAFLLVLMGLDFTWALNRGGCLRYLAVASLAFGAFIVAPRSLYAMLHYDWRSNEFDTMLEQDLALIGPAHLQNSVQCFDMAGGCIATLYNMRIVQSTGYLYDCYLFVAPISASARRQQAEYRAGFAVALSRQPPGYLIVSSDECGTAGVDFSYSKLTRWPWLASLLARDYRLVADRVPTRKEGWEGKPVLPYGYRLYARAAPQVDSIVAPPRLRPVLRFEAPR